MRLELEGQGDVQNGPVCLVQKAGGFAEATPPDVAGGRLADHGREGAQEVPSRHARGARQGVEGERLIQLPFNSGEDSLNGEKRRHRRRKASGGGRRDS